MSGKRNATKLAKGRKLLDIQNEDISPPIRAIGISSYGDQSSNIRMSDVECSSVENVSIAHAPRNVTGGGIEAFLVDNDVVHAFPLELQSPIWQRRLFTVIFTILLIAVILFLVVFLTRKSPVATGESDVSLLLQTLKPLLTFSSRQELEVPGSVPFQALHWLVNESNFYAYPLNRQIQRFALAVFFISTQGVSWNIRSGWLTDFDECTWYQSYTNDVCVNGTLNVLSLSSNNVSGSLPNEIALLSSLEVLELASNNLMGSIPLEMSNLLNLTTLDLQNNLYEDFPTGLPNNLQVLLFSNNILRATLPVNDLSQLNELRILDLSSCDLKGAIPTSIGLLTSLETLRLGFNSLIGNIPTEIGMMKTLKELLLLNNLLSDQIPSEIGLCKELSVMVLKDIGGVNESSNAHLPSEIGMLSELTFFDISFNYGINGAIPSELGQCTELTFLDLGANNLSGTVPSEIGQLVKLTALLLGYNKLSGSLPTEIGMLDHLEHLMVRENDMAGTIPDTLCASESGKVAVMSTSSHFTCSCC